MSDLLIGLRSLSDPERTLAFLLHEYYVCMKELESDAERGGKQATRILMAVNDISDLFVVKGFAKGAML